MEKRVELSLLMDFYAPLLTEHRRRVLEMYLNEDMGLQEIADNLGISRQGVHEAVKTASAQLIKYEKMLSIAQRYMNIRREVDICRNAVEKNDPTEALAALERIDSMA